MSVIQIDPTAFGKVASTLVLSRYADDFSWCIFDANENAEMRSLLAHLDPNEFTHRLFEAKNTMITAWVDRLYLANQLAAALAYANEREFTVQHLPAGMLSSCQPYATLTDFYEQLRFIQYNLYTNAGRCMFSHEDMFRLVELINAVASRIIQDIDHTQG